MTDWQLVRQKQTGMSNDVNVYNGYLILLNVIYGYLTKIHIETAFGRQQKSLFSPVPAGKQWGSWRRHSRTRLCLGANWSCCNTN